MNISTTFHEHLMNKDHKAGSVVGAEGKFFEFSDSYITLQEMAILRLFMTIS